MLPAAPTVILFGNHSNYPGNGGLPFPAVKISSIEATATTVMVTDGLGGPFVIIDSAGDGLIAPSTFGQIPSLIQVNGFSVPDLSGVPARHLETTNVLYCDGHVKAQKISSLMTRVSTGSYFKAFTIQDD